MWASGPGSGHIRAVVRDQHGQAAVSILPELFA